MPKRRNGCSGKVAHATREGAVATLKRVGNAGLSAYRCPLCKAWHLGRSRGAGRDWKFQRRLDQLLERHEGTGKA
jgi:hypothetical protein